METKEADILLEYLKKQVSDYSLHSSTPEYPEPQVKCYTNSQDKQGTLQPIQMVIDAIKKFSEIKEYPKKQVRPIVQFSVSENHTNKKAINVTKHSKLVLLDIDKKDNPNIDFTELKKKICEFGYTYACFFSPSGGLKVLVNTNIENIAHHKAYFFAIVDIYKYYFQVNKIDVSGQDISRQCYLNHDPDVYFNPQARRFFLQGKEIQSSDTLIQKHKNKGRRINNKPIGITTSIDYYSVYSTLLKKRTEEGIYKEIFNNYRFNNINNNIMSTSVPILELFIMQQLEKGSLDYETRIDEIYFGEDKQKSYSVKEGIEYTKIILNDNAKIRVGARNKTLGSITMQLIFNNPIITLERLFIEVRSIFYKHCDRNPDYPFTEKEIYDIVSYNFLRYINGEMDFSSVIRKQKRKPNKVSKKHVFRSRECVFTSIEERQLDGIRTLREGQKEAFKERLSDALDVLQDGNKITHNRLAEYLGVNEKTIDRYMNENPVIAELKKKYNMNL